MTVENISWSISTKECCRPRQGLNPIPPGLQSDGTSKWATKAGWPLLSINLYVKGCLDYTVGVFHMSIPAEPSPSEWKSRSSMPSCVSSSLDLSLTMSCTLTLQIFLIIAQSFCCRHWRFGFVNSLVSLAGIIALCTQELYMRLFELLPGGFHMCCGWKFTATGCWEHVSLVAKGSYHLQLVRSDLDFPLWSAIHGPCSSLASCTSNQGPLSSAWAHCIFCAPSTCSFCRRCCCCPLQCDRWCMEIRLNSAGGQILFHRSWSLSFLHLLSVLSPPLLLSKLKASWHIPRMIQRW